MSREDPQTKLRLPPDLKERVERAARAAGRSLNSEIVARLAASFESDSDRLAALEYVVFDKLRGIDALADAIADLQARIGGR